MCSVPSSNDNLPRLRGRFFAFGTDEAVDFPGRIGYTERKEAGYPLVKRGIYSCSRMISSQYGREFTRSHYEKIKKVYSIWICMHPPKYRENTITRYRMTEETLVGQAQEPVRNYDLLSVILLCLGNPDGADSVLRMLDVLLGDQIDPADKQKILQDDYEIRMTQHIAQEVSDMCNLSKGIEERAHRQGHAQGIEQGIVQGVKQGIAQGVKQGVAQGEKKFAHLTAALLAAGRYQELQEAAENQETRSRLYAELGIQ